MFLSDKQIQEYIANQKLSITPFIPENLKPGSYTFTLSSQIRKFSASAELIDANENSNKLTEIDITSGYILQPNEFIIGYTNETVTLPDNILCILGTRGSMAQIGLNVLQSSIIAEPGTNNIFALEISNHNTIPIKILPGLKICKGVFLEKK